MTKINHNFKKKYVGLTRGFFSLPIISIFCRLSEKELILNKKFFFKKNLLKTLNKESLEIILDYLESIDLIKKINNEKYSITSFGSYVFRGHGAMNIIYSYKDIVNNLEKFLIGKQKKVECNRIENVYGSGKSHKRKFFENAISIIKKNKISKVIDLGLGNGDFIRSILKTNSKAKFAGVDLSNEVINKLKRELGNSKNMICDDIFKINQWSKKLKENNFNIDDKLLINFMFTLHEHYFDSNDKIKNFLNNIRSRFPKANILITEVFEIPSKKFSKIADNSILPEFILFHKFSRQKLFLYKQLKKIIKESNFYVSTEFTYSKMRVGNFTSPTYSTIFLKPKNILKS
jgi:ubiquinone/menaquinone biosynthesis C-methylase UbiE